MEKRKIYDRNFRVHAVKLGLEKNLFKVTKELGVAPTNIYRWRDELQKYGTESFCGGGYFRNPEQKRFSELKRTLKKSLKNHNLKLKFLRAQVNIFLKGNQ